ncbi:putative chromatin regulator PHD family [Medicago truncatula]|uniref:Putative chromatin regulator PHD family n=1 Tax=Medicago truncatula TaxID=3880 RepID=G7K0L5_MEDTR|nr:uncharacterized protein LOC11419651 [Medicago truncatula]AET01000.1 RING/FYVE/PHD zinc finger protein, putative [Medicago truncatula]RHN58168.1 putative chromatin regulator PHD family [Medicago truncatula]
MEKVVCLTCGDIGFPEVRVFCNNCKDCALHRYCLDGPVIFTEEVIWLCEDCDEETGPCPMTDSETDDSITSEDDFKARPILDANWSGNLRFGDNTINGLMAHLSDLVCPKVWKETELLPDVLSADLLPRSEVWPDSFKKDGPTNKNIALYLFPEYEGPSMDALDNLIVEVIHAEAALRVVTENAQLLIFPSTLLPIQHQKFDSKNYLWGVFRKKQTSNETNYVVTQC